jgi:ATP synthase F1 complex assembly factor 2
VPVQDQRQQGQQEQQHSNPCGSIVSGYQLLLRNYPVKTPAQHSLVLPTRSLALAVAAEWEWLPSGKPVAHVMPLMGLAATAIDQPKPREKVIDHLLKYVHTDAALVR